MEWMHACFDLGLVNVAMIKTGMERGFKASFMIGLGSCFGTLILSYLTYKMLRETIRPRMNEVI